MQALQTAFPILIVIALTAVMAVLLVGMISMFRGGRFNALYGNKLMRLRVIMQGIAVLLIIVYVAFIRGV